ncbi:hypothetical protein BC826DRAFT_1046870 [Russula brevipes]|nr:hypothetical protein BC826DRAFT_1046870 [Russula brevipes]
MGLPTLLRNILGFPHAENISPRGTLPRINLYGPAGLRTFLRTTLSLTRTQTADRYAVHELLTPTDPRTTCSNDALHGNEEPGRDVLCDADGYWRNFAEGHSFRGAVHVCAGPLVHRDPCIGFIIHEPAAFSAPRKLAILGDTSSADQLTALVASTPGSLSLLVHEATDAYIPADVDPQLARRRPPAVVASKTRERGHSTPAEAGACAGKWRARQLIPRPVARFALWQKSRMIREIERQASEAWRTTPCEVPGDAAPAAEECNAVAAYDFLTVQVPLQSSDSGGGGQTTTNRQPTRHRPQKRRKNAHSDHTG